MHVYIVIQYGEVLGVFASRRLAVNSILESQDTPCRYEIIHDEYCTSVERKDIRTTYYIEKRPILRSVVTL